MAAQGSIEEGVGQQCGGRDCDKRVVLPSCSFQVVLWAEGANQDPEPLPRPWVPPVLEEGKKHICLQPEVRIPQRLHGEGFRCSCFTACGLIL